MCVVGMVKEGSRYYKIDVRSDKSRLETVPRGH